MDTIKLYRTDRGFKRGDFIDLYGKECSIQKSSIAPEDAIWLGINNAEPSILAIDALRLGIPTNNTRMHLTREDVKKLIPLLQKFVDTGEL